MSDRSDLIVKYFDYLISDYGFRIEKKEFNPNAMGNAFVNFMSSWIGIQVAIDRNDVLIRLGDPLDRRWDWFDFIDTLKYYAPQIENAYLFPEKKPDNTWDEIVEIQLRRLSDILRQYCEPLLKGQPLVKKDIKKIEEDRVAKKFGRFMRNSP